MSATPRTDAARGFHDMDTAVSAEDMAKLENELAAANKRIADCEFLMEHRYNIIERQDAAMQRAFARAEKAEARLAFLIENGDKFLDEDYGLGPMWNAPIAAIDAAMNKEASK